MTAASLVPVMLMVTAGAGAVILFPSLRGELVHTLRAFREGRGLVAGAEAS